MQKTSLIIPFWNEAEHLETSLTVLQKDISSNVITNLILVDDGSKDESMRIANNWLNKNPNIKEKTHIIKHPTNLGKGAALIDGFKQSIQLGDDFIITIDADLRYIGKGLLKKVIQKMKGNNRIEMMILLAGESSEKLYKVYREHLKGNYYRSYIKGNGRKFSGQRIFRTKAINNILEKTDIKQALYKARHGIETGLNTLTNEKNVMIYGLYENSRKDRILFHEAGRLIDGETQEHQSASIVSLLKNIQKKY